MSERPLILISNDDGVDMQGIHVLTDIMNRMGDVVVVAPDRPRSGMGCSLTPTQDVRLTLKEKKEGLSIYVCSGTPVDCIKLALEKAVPRKPDMMVCGINHGDNASVSIHYSGTMGAVMEACIKGIPAIGYSLQTHDTMCDFSPYVSLVSQTASHVLAHGLERGTCLNVNFPQVARLRGVSVCRLACGVWEQEWIEGKEPGTFRLTGRFRNLEPEAEDTDYWALTHGMASITPLTLDMTHYPSLSALKVLEGTTETH